MVVVERNRLYVLPSNDLNAFDNKNSLIVLLGTSVICCKLYAFNLSPTLTERPLPLPIFHSHFPISLVSWLVLSSRLKDRSCRHFYKVKESAIGKTSHINNYISLNWSYEFSTIQWYGFYISVYVISYKMMHNRLFKCIVKALESGEMLEAFF